MRKSKKGAVCLLLLMLLCVTALSGCAQSKKNVKPEITKLADLAEKNVVSLTGSVFATVLDDAVSGVTHLYLNDLPSQLEAVKSQKASAAILDEPVARLAVAQHPDLAILEEPLLGDSYGFAFKKGDPMAEEVSSIIRQFKEDGVLKEMEDKWFGVDESVKTIQDFTYKSDYDGSAGVLRFSHDTSLVPMCYAGEDGRSMGFDVELAKRIAYELNMEFKPTIMDFSSLIMSLGAGKSDMIGSCISITEERKKSVDFSEPYYQGGMVAVVKKPAAAMGKDAAGSEAVQNEGITTLSQLSGGKIGMLTGSIYDKYIGTSIPGGEAVYFNNLSDQVEALKAGKLSAVIYDEPGLLDIMQNNKGMAILDEDLGDVEFGMIAGKDKAELIARVNEVLTGLSESGELKRIEEKWFGEEEAKKVLPDFPLPATNGVLRVATNSISPPNAYVKDNKIVGYEVELAMHAAKELGMGFEITDMDFAALIPAVSTGKADLAVGQICITDERKESVLFTMPCSSSRICLLVRNEKTPSSAMVSGTGTGVPLETARFGVMTGSTGEILVGKEYPDARISSYDTFPDAVAGLTGGKLDYVIGSYTSMLNYAKANPSLMITPDVLSTEANAIALKKGNTELCERINGVLEKLKEDGTLADLERRWIKPDTTPYEQKEIPKAESGEILRVAISADREPICFVMDGRYVGFDCELIERIAYELNMQVEYQNMKFAGLISALQAGKADVVISNLTRTEERAESVEFTDAYFDNPQTLLTRKSVEAVKPPWYQSLVESFTKTFIIENRYQLILQGLGTTLLISVFSAILGTLLGFGICLMRRAKSRWLSIPAKVFVGVIQGTPIVVMLMILFYIILGEVDISPVLVAIIGFSINFAAYVSEMMRTGIDAVDKGQLEAASAIGFNKVQVFLKITMPQALRHLLPVFKGEFISMIKMTSVVGYIAIQDLTKMSDIIRSRTYEAFFPLIATALIYLVLSYLVVFLLSGVEYKVDPKHRRRIVKGVTDK